ncbi:MAG: hypothetical protein RSB41_00225 [Bacilli bacterium]
MQNKNIKNALNTILPDKESKDKMLNNILNHKKISPFLSFIPLGVFVVLISFCITLFIPKQIYNDDSTPVATLKRTNDIIHYKDNCFIDTNNISLKQNKGNYLFTIKDKPLKGHRVYKNKLDKDTLLVLKDKELKIFSKCN